MKKIILAAVAVLAFGSATAQEIKFGVKGGLNIATNTTNTIIPVTSQIESPTPAVTSAIDSSLESLYGFNLGGFVNIKISDKFSVQPELLFSMQGTKLVLSVPNSSSSQKVTSKFSTNYIILPIMAKFMVAEKFSLQAGPQIGLLISATNNLSSSFTGPFSVNIDFKDMYNNVDFGLNFGAGYEITDNLFVDLRYNLGLTQLQKNLIPGQLASKNRVFSINFGYSF